MAKIPYQFLGWENDEGANIIAASLIYQKVNRSTN
jgi:hypothetical protein